MNAPHSKQPNSLNSFPNKIQNYKPPKMNNQKNEGYSSNNNIYSGYSSHTGGNIYAQTNENNNQKPKNNIINGASSNRNIYNVPPKINIPQSSGNINQGHIQKESGDMPLFPSNIVSINDKSGLNWSKDENGKYYVETSYDITASTGSRPSTSTELLIPNKKHDLNRKFCHCCECCECFECIECCSCCQCGE